MPRQARLDAPGVLHHIMLRGINRRNIFRGDKDREDFLERLAKILPAAETACYAWALLPNHAHFLFRTGPEPLATVMRRLLTGYVVGYNLRHDRQGHLFQNRYKSIVCQEDAYFSELIRYIHLNPLRAGIVADLRELNKYPYCGHSAVIGNKKRLWQDVEYVLRYFGGKAEIGRKAYLDYLAKGVSQGRRDDLTGGGLIRSLGGWAEVRRLRPGRDHVMSDERILGDSEFVESILSRADERYERRYDLERRGYDLEKIAQRVAEIYGVDTDYVFSRGRQKQRVKARSLFCYWAARELGISQRVLASKLELSGPGIGLAVERGEAIARENGYRLISE